MSEMRIEPVGGPELRWIAQHVEIARVLYGGRFGDDTVAPGVDELDALWAASLAEPDPAVDANTLVNVVGLAFGQTLVEELDLTWAIVTDEYGTEIAVHEARGDVLVFPPNLIAKRWESRETGFLRSIYDEIAVKLGQLRA